MRFRVEDWWARQVYQEVMWAGCPLLPSLFSLAFSVPRVGRGMTHKLMLSTGPFFRFGPGPEVPDNHGPVRKMPPGYRSGVSCLANAQSMIPLLLFSSSLLSRYSFRFSCSLSFAFTQTGSHKWLSALFVLACRDGFELLVCLGRHISSRWRVTVRLERLQQIIRRV